MKRHKLPDLLPLAFWFTAFFAVWACAALPLSPARYFQNRWPLAIGMILRSLFSGVSPLGSGAIGLPFLISTEHQSLASVRDFALAMQAIGMVSAATYVLCRRMTVDWPMVTNAACGCLIGTPLGLRYLTPLAPFAWVIALYCAAWTSFGLAILGWGSQIATHKDQLFAPGPKLERMAFLSGLFGGGIFASVLGGGGGLPFYAVMVLLRRTSLRTAVASCTLLMGFNSLLALSVRLSAGELEPSGFSHWLAAAPIVCLGVPIGFLVLERCRPAALLLFAATLCIALSIWVVLRFHSELGPGGFVAVALGILYFTKGCWTLNWAGCLMAEGKGRDR